VDLEISLGKEQPHVAMFHRRETHALSMF